jgi:hypothetical protein
MTFRAKPAVKRSHRPAFQSSNRRTLLMNLAFGLIVLIALLILAGAGVASWYGDHLAALAAVNGQQITKDDYRDRAVIEDFRLNYRETQIRGQMQAGKLDDATGNAELNAISNARQTIQDDTINHLIDATLQAQPAGPNDGRDGQRPADRRRDDEGSDDAGKP